MREALTLAGGNELVVGLSLAAWLIGVGWGATIAGRLPGSHRALVLSALLSPVVCGAAFTGLRMHRLIISVPVGGDPSLFQLVGLLGGCLACGGLAVGFVFTAAARTADGPQTGPVSRLYTAEAIGALVGGLGFAFFLAGHISHLAVLGLAGAALPLAVHRTGGRRFTRASTLLYAVVLLALLGPLSHLDQLTAIRAFDDMSTGGRFVASTQSAYGRLTISRNEDQYQLYIDNRLDHAFPDPWDRAAPIHLALSQHPRPKRILLIGGGPSDTLDAALAHRPERVVLTYLDNRVHQLCRPFWSSETHAALSDSRVAVIQDDGRRFAMTTAERFDGVIVSAPPPRSAQANRYHTQEFFLAIRRILTDTGVMTVLAPGGANQLAPEAARAAALELNTVRSVFPRVIAISGLNTAIHAAVHPDVLTTSPRVLADRFTRRGIETPYFSARRFEWLIDEDRIADTVAQLDRWPSGINRDARPLVYLANLQLWERSLSGEQATNLPTWTGRAEQWSWVWLALPLLIWLLFKTTRSQRPIDQLFSMITTGAVGMAVEVMVLYMYQAVSGQLYTGLALLIALFMAGLAGGAHLSRYLQDRRWGTLSDLSVLGLVLATDPVLSSSLSYPWLTPLWSLIGGIVTGAAFPILLVSTARFQQTDERRAAASIEAADHYGAAFGALVTGVIWLPVLGLRTTCIWFAGLKLASLVGPFLPRRTVRSPS